MVESAVKYRMNDWPQVIGEFETVKKIRKGFSIGRAGDGEFKVMDGKAYVRMRWIPNPALTEELRQFMAKPNASCLIGIPTMDPLGNKYEKWKRYKVRFGKWLDPERQYYSAFISRPDCGTAWLECRGFADALRTIWLGKRIAIVCESYSKLLVDVRETNEVVEHIECPMYDAYNFIDDYEKEILTIKPEIVLLSAGMTATVLANRISGHGIQAVDLGSIGAFLQRWPA